MPALESHVLKTEDCCLEAVEDCFKRSVLEIGENVDDIPYLKVSDAWDDRYQV